MITVEITGGCYICDEEDYKMLREFTWCIANYGYVATNINDPVTGKRKTNVKMHRILFPNYKECDHINRVKHDNRRENLRNVTRSENIYNSGKRKNSSSRYKGVTWNKNSRCWVAQIQVRGGRIHLGYFYDELDASDAYLLARVKYGIDKSYDGEQVIVSK